MSSKPVRHSEANPHQPVPTIDLTTPSQSRVETGGAQSAVAQEVAQLLSPAESPDELGRLGHFRVLGILGTGGMGIVLQAEDELLHRPAALKVMRPALTRDTVAVGRFLREARAAAGVKHRHVVTVYEVGMDRGTPFLAMELLSGASLEQRLKDGPEVSLPEAVRIARQAAEGLSAAHACGLIHRDVKPSNIWLEAPSGDVKFLDFGLARLARDDLQLTHTGAVVGSPHYMAPEQARGGEVDFRCDLFSLGCVLYQLVTRRQPFSGVSLTAVLTSLAVDSPAPPESLNSQVPLPLAELIKRLLAKDPAARPGSAAEVAQQLAAIEPSLADVDSSSRPRAGQSSHLPRATPRSWRRSAWLVALAAVLALAAGLWSVWTWDARPRPDGRKMAPADHGAADAQHKSKGQDDQAAASPTPPGPAFPPLDAEWEQSTMALAPTGQVDAVMRELDRRNPGFLGSGNIEVGYHNQPNTTEPDAVIGLKIPAGKLVDLTPLGVLTRLENLNCSSSAENRSPLEDLTPLALLPLRDLHLSNTSVADLTPLTRMPLDFLDLRNTPVADLTPLKDQNKLKSLFLSGTSVRDLKPLVGLDLKVLHLRNIAAEDLSLLAGLKLEELELDFDPKRHTELVKSLEELKRINGQGREEFLKAADESK